ncbi:protocadherin gamma-B3-like isoform X2 [Spea bombifrons]|uniref:protocadherin gamma-B3-like isoform X2 n=1 Tax=Spea bombifrons TaxID=233779 RepID=UPI0023490DDC|nr:protocadherin gamma-B3-like isoform X2 [Spea bombifrons]
MIHPAGYRVLQVGVLHLFLLWLLVNLTYAQFRYSIPEELNRGEIVGNIAKDLGTDVAKLVAANLQQAQANIDWHFSQAQKPSTSGAQPSEDAGVWPNNPVETERLQAMILASATEAAEGSNLGGGTGTMGLGACYGPQFTLQHVPDYRQNIYIPGTATLTNAAVKHDGKAALPSGGNKKKATKKEKK